jgi:Na+/H+ antiporter NhaD/arsenite permease-like protein
LWAITAVATLVAVALSEVTSNTAAASMLVPVALSIALAAGVHPVPPAIGTCLGASLAFMFPISTPPNALVYGTGRVPITLMIRYGVLMDLIGFAIIMLGLRVLYPLMGLREALRTKGLWGICDMGGPEPQDAEAQKSRDLWQREKYLAESARSLCSQRRRRP